MVAGDDDLKRVNLNTGGEESHALQQAEQEIARLQNEIAKLKRAAEVGREASRELRDSEEKYHTIFNSIDEGFGIIELIYDDKQRVADVRYLETNLMFEKHTGMKRVAGQLASVVTPHTEDSWLDTYDKVLKTGERVSMEICNAFSQRWYSVYIFRLSEIRRELGVAFTDITERKQHQKQQDYLMKLSDALRSSTDPVSVEETATRLAMEYFGADRCCYCSIEGDKVVVRRDFYSTGLASVAGTYALNDFPVYKKSVSEGVPLLIPDVHTSVLFDETLRQRSIEAKSIAILNIPLVKNGVAKGLFCLVQSKPRQWSEMELNLGTETAERVWAAMERAGAEQALRDSGERLRDFNVQLENKVKERTQELEENRELLATVYDNIPSGIAVMAPVYDKQGRITDFMIKSVNRAMEKDTQRKDLVGKYYAQQYPGIKQMGLFDIMLRVMETGETESKEYYYEYDGFEKWFSSMFIRTSEGLVATNEDISERKNVEKAWQQTNEDLKYTIGQLESFNFIASHDLQEPLRKIQTFANLLSHSGVDDARLEKYLSRIHDASARMSLLINDLLSYSRLSRQSDSFQPLDLNRVLHDVQIDYELLIKEKQAIIVSEKLPVISAVPFQLHQLFANLLANSLKFTQTVPDIRISCKMVKGADINAWDAAVPGSTYAEISFADNGIGFSGEYTEQIFQMFQRLHSQAEFPGTGIGLSIVEKVIKHHKGFITATGEEGKGAVFTMWLPVSRA